MTDLVLRPLADAFMQVSVFVAVLVAPFSLARWKWGDRLDAALRRRARFGPLVAAAATMPPGCGGAILVMTLYSRGCATFGTAVAALCATMGDATWLLLAAEPVLTLKIKAMLFVTGAATGYAVDALGITPRRRALVPAAPALVSAVPALVPAAPALVRAAALPEPAGPGPVGSGPASMPGAGRRGGGPGAGYALWALAGAGFAVGLPVTFNLIDPAALAARLGGFDLYLVLGLAGTVMAAAVLLLGRGGHGGHGSHGTAAASPGSAAGTLRQGAHEVAFVTVWVAAAYLAWQFITSSTGFDGSELPLLGLAGVAVGALIGLIPGCGVQMVFAGIFLAGGMPLPTLLANTISQDGDALLPLLALERRSAVLATVLTTIPALLVGSAGFLLW
jgi:hypothetical protein